MRKIILLVGLLMLAAPAAMAGRTPDAGGGDQFKSPLYDPQDASPAERKLLNGDGEGKPGPVDQNIDENDHGSSGCTEEDDCERAE
jgi:hypothetical protein